MPTLLEKLKKIKSRSNEQTHGRGAQADDFYLMRDGWEATDNYLLIDRYSFAIEAAAGGKTLLVNQEPGASREAGDERGNSHQIGTDNTLTIDENLQDARDENFAPKFHAAAKTHLWISEERFDFFEGSRTARASLENPVRHTRGVLFVKNDYWIMRDFVETRGTHDYALDFLFDDEINPALESTNSGVLCVGETNSGSLDWRLITFGDNGEWRRETKPDAATGREKNSASRLRFMSSSTGSQEFFTFFLPAPKFQAKPEILEATVRGGRAFLIKYGSYFDFFVFADGGQIVRTEFFNTNFRFFWARMNEGEPRPEEFVMIDGSNFSLGVREIINYPQKLKYAVARRLGNRLNVRTSASLFSVSLPRKHSSMLILKNNFDA